MKESAAAIRRREAAEAEQDSLHRAVRLLIVAVAVATVILTAFFGGIVATVTVLVIAASTVQGLWRGATELVGLLIGLILAGLFAAPIGRALEGAVGSIAGTTGMTNRLLSTAL